MAVGTHPRRKRARSACLAFALLLLSAGAAVAEPADPDSSFDGDGIRTIRANSGDRLFPDAVALQADGKIVVAGRLPDPSTYWVKRLNTDGSDDPSFAGGDVATASFAPKSVETLNRVVVAPDGKVVLVGTVSQSTNNVVEHDAAAARFTQGGSPDLTFGSVPGNGRQTYDYGSKDDAGATMLFPPLGTTFPQNGAMILAVRGADTFAATRLDDHGLSTGTPSTVGVDFGGAGQLVEGAATTTDGKIVIAGSTSNSNFGVVRINPDLSLDNSFNGTGKQVVGFDASAFGREVVVQPDNKIVVVGDGGSGQDFLVARLNTDGSPDMTFSGDGKANIGIARALSARQAALQSNGRIVLVGSEYFGFGGSNADIARLNADGAPDTTFAPAGIRTYTALGTGQGTAIHANGAINVVGASDDGTVLQLRGDPPQNGGGDGGNPGGTNPGGGNGGTGGTGGTAQFCGGKRATIVGTAKPNVLRGTKKADVIVGLGGADKIRGLAGNDRICGGKGNDLIDGGNGNDRLFGDDGNDRISGGLGNDTLGGGKGIDKLGGGKGSDKCAGNAGHDSASACENKNSL